MAQSSIFWPTNGTGHGATSVDATTWQKLIRALFLTDPATQGVLEGYLNELAVSGTATPLAVATGAAVVYGLPYFNSASENLTVATPGVGTTGGHVILTANWTAQTVTLSAVSNTDGTIGIPSLTQTADTTWQIRLATYTITTGGVITVTDARAYLQPAIVAQTANIANDAITVAKVGAGIAQCDNRQGGDTNIWSTAGTSDYTPGAIKEKFGAKSVTVAAGAVSAEATINFNAAFAYAPLVWATVVQAITSTAQTQAHVNVSTPTTTTVKVVVTRANPTDTTLDQTVTVNWLAKGPE
jgi:hypothetical protein